LPGEFAVHDSGRLAEILKSSSALLLLRFWLAAESLTEQGQNSPQNNRKTTFAAESESGEKV
jgi:hypothetical protein